MKILLKKETERELQKIDFFDFANFEGKKNCHKIIIALKEEKLGDSILYNKKNKIYIRLMDELKSFFGELIKSYVKKKILIKTSFKNSWITSGIKKALKKEEYFEYLSFLKKNRVINYFDGSIILQKKELEKKFLDILLEMNIENKGDFEFIFDNKMVLGINHHMEFFIFIKNKKDLKNLMKIITKNKFKIASHS